jgi:hypothetical protein
MIPPTKAAAPQVRTSGRPFLAAARQARPLAPKAFKTLLTAPGKQPPLASAKEPKKEKEASAAAAPVVVRPSLDEEKPRPKASATEKPEKPTDLLDPTARVTAHLALPMASSSVAPTEQVSSRARVSLEELVPQVLRRIAWGGDRTKGTACLELTSGDKVTVHAEGRRVRIEVDGNEDLERRIASRLRAAGIEVESIR